MPMGTMKVRIEPQMAEEVQFDTVRVINIQSPDGDDMYHIMIRENGTLEVRTGGFIKIDGRVKDKRIMIQPEATNSILITRPDYDSEA